MAAAPLHHDRFAMQKPCKAQHTADPVFPLAQLKVHQRRSVERPELSFHPSRSEGQDLPDGHLPSLPMVIWLKYEHDLSKGERFS